MRPLIYNQRQGLVGACFIAVLAMACASSALAIAAESREGTIGSVQDARFTLNEESVEHMFHWNEETSVTLNGEAIEIADLQAGDAAVVTFHLSDDGTMLAMSVEATRPQ